MAGQQPQDADVDAINTRLSESLATCRTVVKDYRIALSGTQAAGGEPIIPEEKPAAEESS